MPSKLLLAAPRGYCAGVDRAVQTVERALDALRRAGLRPQGDRPQQARGRAAARARRDLRRRARDEVPEGAMTVFSAHGVVARGPRGGRAPQPAHDRRDLPAGDQGPRRGGQVRRRGLHDRPHRPRGPRGGRGHDGRGARAHRARRDRGGRRRPRGRRPDKVAYISQTTLSVDETRAIIDRLREKFPHIVGPAHRRHLLRHDEPPGGRQADGAAVRPRARDRLAQLVELQPPGRGRARARRRRRT